MEKAGKAEGPLRTNTFFMFHMRLRRSSRMAPKPYKAMCVPPLRSSTGVTSTRSTSTAVPK